jgi:hypothetical protein
MLNVLAVQQSALVLCTARGIAGGAKSRLRFWAINSFESMGVLVVNGVARLGKDGFVL